MGNKKNLYPKTIKITLAQQQVALRVAYPECRCNTDGKRLVWMGKIRPTPLSQEYKVMLTLELDRPPQVWVIVDELKRLDDPDFPHVFKVDKEAKMVRICLYRYQEEFNSGKYLSQTVIPWTVEWLYHYEIWLATGEWCGGGEHPQEGEPKEDNVAP
jgi:hypothetical protein